jgi:hypothetical protein
MNNVARFVLPPPGSHAAVRGLLRSGWLWFFAGVCLKMLICQRFGRAMAINHS